MHVNAALPNPAARLRQLDVLRQIPKDQKLPNAYRNSPSYGTLPPSRRAMRSTTMKRVLIIEDDKDIVELVRYNLANEGFQVSAALDGMMGLATLKKTPPDLLLLDLMLPKLSGLEICREIRRDDSLNRLPILMLTARGEEADRVVGLEMGADDYVTKPFSPRELLARVKALLRRAEPPGDAPRTIEIGKLAIDPASYRVSHSGKPVPLSTLEFRCSITLPRAPTVSLPVINCSMQSGERIASLRRAAWTSMFAACVKKSSPIRKTPCI